MPGRILSGSLDSSDTEAPAPVMVTVRGRRRAGSLYVMPSELIANEISKTFGENLATVATAAGLLTLGVAEARLVPGAFSIKAFMVLSGSLYPAIRVLLSKKACFDKKLFALSIATALSVGTPIVMYAEAKILTKLFPNVSFEGKARQKALEIRALWREQADDPDTAKADVPGKMHFERPILFGFGPQANYRITRLARDPYCVSFARTQNSVIETATEKTSCGFAGANIGEQLFDGDLMAAREKIKDLRASYSLEPARAP